MIAEDLPTIHKLKMASHSDENRLYPDNKLVNNGLRNNIPVHNVLCLLSLKVKLDNWIKCQERAHLCKFWEWYISIFKCHPLETKESRCISECSGGFSSQYGRQSHWDLCWLVQQGNKLGYRRNHSQSSSSGQWIPKSSFLHSGGQGSEMTQLTLI